MDNGEVKRDEYGRITEGRRLSSKVAAAIARRRWSQPREQRAAALIAEAGFDDPDAAPMALQIVCEQATAGGARSIQAIIEYTRWMARRSGGTPGEIGPTVTTQQIGPAFPRAPGVSFADRLQLGLHSRAIRSERLLAVAWSNCGKLGD